MTASLTIHPVLLCGGSGTRLWPVSRASFPKQFKRLAGKHSLFQDTVTRLSGAGFTTPLVITDHAFRFIVTEQLAAIEQDATLLVEPVPRNTAPAALAAAFWLKPDALMLVAPSDHVIPDDTGFRACVQAAAQTAKNGGIVTFGIAPDRPETGYGYLELPDGVDPMALDTPAPLKGFVEKPCPDRAAAMLAEGRFLWNAGLFLCRADTLIQAYADHAPALLEPCHEAVAMSTTDLGFFRLAPDHWGAIEPVSIDYAIMEKARNLRVMPWRGDWSDLGDWSAIWQAHTPDEQGNVLSQNTTALDCSGSLLRSEDEGLELVGLGLTDIIAVALPDAVLVAHKSHSQQVKTAVAHLAARGAAQATKAARDHRPWGWFETLALGPRFHVKRIVVNPGGVLSLQSHHHRSEHWVVVSGTARVTVNDRADLVSENQSIYIPLGAQHRLENPGKLPMVLIEIQTGAYLGEDDIIRHEDIYARV